MITVQTAFIRVMITRFEWMSFEDLERVAQRLPMTDVAEAPSEQAFKELSDLLEKANPKVTELVAAHFAKVLRDRLAALDDFPDHDDEEPRGFFSS